MKLSSKRSNGARKAEFEPFRNCFRPHPFLALLSTLLACGLDGPLLSGQTDAERETRSQRYVEQGRELQKVGDVNGAISDFNEAIRVNPKNAAAYLYRGKTREKGDDLDSAITDYSKAIVADPQYDPAYYERGRAEMKKEDWEGAHADLSKAIELNKTNPVYFEKRANLRMERHLYAEAVRDYERLANLFPDSPLPLGSLGRAKYWSGDVNGALETYNKVLKKFRRYAGGYALRGNLKALQGLAESALVDFNKAIKLEPDNAGFVLTRGMFFFGKGDYEKAKSDLLTGLKLAREGETIDYANLWLWLIDAHFGKTKGAGVVLRNYLESRPEDKALDWLDSLARFLLKDISEEELMREAEDGDSVREIEQRCEAYFYSAQVDLLESRGERAKSRLKKSLATGLIGFYEYKTAFLQLKNL